MNYNSLKVKNEDEPNTFIENPQECFKAHPQIKDNYDFEGLNIGFEFSSM